MAKRGDKSKLAEDNRIASVTVDLFEDGAVRARFTNPARFNFKKLETVSREIDRAFQEVRYNMIHAARAKQFDSEQEAERQANG